MEDSKRRLIWHGMFLFLLGLLTGFAEQKFINPRMGLAAHLEGVMNGTFLVLPCSSRRVNGCMLKYAALPARLSATFLSKRKLAEPLKMKRPGRRSLSTARLITLRISGNFCASSIVMGWETLTKLSGLFCAAARVL